MWQSVPLFDFYILFPYNKQKTDCTFMQSVPRGRKSHADRYSVYLSLSDDIIRANYQIIKGEIMETLLIIAILILAAVLFIKLVLKTTKGFLKFIINTALAFVLLWLVNFFGDPVGININMNFLNVAIVGIAGLPGLILLVLIQLLI